MPPKNETLEKILKTHSKKQIRIKTTITIPLDWKDKIDEFMKKMGFQDYAELFRHLIRTSIVEKAEGIA